MEQKFMRFYNFGDFRLDSREKVLVRCDEPVLLTPKVFETLLILVQNAGNLLEKEFLMDRIWQDRFVDESNLTYNIKVLRRALGDSAKVPIFIENVPRRGYRFVADVRSSDENEQQADLNADEDDTSVKGGGGIVFRQQSGRHVIYAVGAVLFIFSAAFASWYFGNRHSVRAEPIRASEPRIESFSTTGQVYHALISPDGKRVAYVSSINEQTGLWLRDLATSINTQLLPPSGEPYFGLRFSNAGDYLYFVRGRGYPNSAAIYRVPLSGGIPKLLIEKVQGWISLSPDDRRIAFVRTTGDSDHPYSLMIADIADGSEKSLVTVTRPNRISALDWSPDGKTIAFAVGQSENGGNQFRLAEVDVENGKERDLTHERWFCIGGIAWFADQSGLLITANADVSETSRIWRVSRSNGEAHPVTSDAANYIALSMNPDASLVVATTSLNDFRLETTELQAEQRAKVLSPAFESVIHAPDGRMVFTTRSDSQEDIWIVNRDGTDPTQITNDPRNDTTPIISPDNRHIFFATNRFGSYQIWRMSIDGSDQRQITRNEGGYPIFISKDGREIYYWSAAHKNIWKTTTDGGEEQLVFEKQVSSPSISPDGRYLAYLQMNGNVAGIRVIAWDNSVPERLVPLVEKVMVPLQVEWSSDGTSLIYSGRVNARVSIWQQSISEAPPKMLADLGDDSLMQFSISPDEKSLATIRGKWKHDVVLIRGLE